MRGWVLNLLFFSHAYVVDAAPVAAPHLTCTKYAVDVTPRPETLVENLRKFPSLWSQLMTCVLDIIGHSSSHQLMLTPDMGRALLDEADAQQIALAKPPSFLSDHLRKYRFAFACFLYHILGQPGSSQALIMANIVGYGIQLYLGRALQAAGARDFARVLAGEWHRLVTSCFLHADPIHLARSCFFGIARLMPAAASVYGNTQSVLIYLLSAVGGNLVSFRLNRASALPSMGASAAIFGIEGALLAYGLRNEPSNIYGLILALRRTLVSVRHLATHAQTCAACSCLT